MIEWRFKPNSKDDMDVDPIQGEFFTTRDTPNISTALIREGIQNALDERSRDDNNETVKVRIFLSGDKYALSSDEYQPLLTSLKPHLESKNAGITSFPDFELPMRFLVFEDFNTKGLEGDPEEFYVDNITDNNPHNFYYFWRNVGRSGKSDDKLGRWGLGKTVFPASSQIHTFWGLTVRKSDKRKLLLGQCILRIHNREDEKKQDCGFKPYGMYGNYKAEDCFAIPVEKEDQTSQFENLFKLERKNTSGLSVIIPFCSNEITADYLAYSVIEQYFYPILEGKLQVEVKEVDNTILLDRSTILESIDKIQFDKLSGSDEKKIKSKESLQKLFDFAKWTLGLSESDYFRLNPLDIKLKPRWSKQLFSDETGLDLLRERFDKNERVAFKIPLKYQPVKEIPQTCWFHAYLEKDNALTKPESLFIRDGITITGITSLDRGLVRGMVIIHDVNLARLLGDSENPAHTEWQTDSRNFKGKYVDGKETLIFVKSTIRALFEKLQRPLEGLQKDLLIDFFSIPITTEEVNTYPNSPDKKKKGDDEVNEPEVPLLPGKRSPVLMEKIVSGIKIFRNPEANEFPDSIRLKLGYDVPKGNPIKSYQVLDFDVSKSPIKIESSGVYFNKMEKNELEFEIENKDSFDIKLLGFDENRDLFVKLQ